MPGLGDRGSAGVSGEPVALPVLHPARLGGRIWDRGWGRRQGKGASAEAAGAAGLRRPGREGGSGERRWALREPREAPPPGGGSARDKSAGTCPLPALGAQTRAGERDPCPDPSPRPARAITKETRPPALRSPRRLKTDPSAGTGRQEGFFLQGLVLKDKSGRPHSADQSKALNGGHQKASQSGIRSQSPEKRTRFPFLAATQLKSP